MAGQKCFECGGHDFWVIYPVLGRYLCVRCPWCGEVYSVLGVAPYDREDKSQTEGPMATQTEILLAHGVKNPEITIRAAKDAGLPLAAACVVLMQETAGGSRPGQPMIWGHDKVNTGGTYTKGGPVTKENYLAYKKAVKAGRIRRQGVGDCQLTSSEYQDRADTKVGAWDPYSNQWAGFAGLARLISKYGVQQGARRYNGAGPKAEAYGRRFLASYNIWQGWLQGITDEGAVTGTVGSSHQQQLLLND